MISKKYSKFDLYTASAVAFVFAVLNISYGAYMDVIVYLFLAIFVSIFKNSKIAAAISIVISSVYFIMVLISYLAENSTELEVFLALFVFYTTILFYRTLNK